MRTNKRIGISRTNLSTARAGLGSQVRIDIFDNQSFSFGFVLDERLQLPERPVVNPSVQPLSHIFIPTVSYSSQIFQCDIGIFDNLFAHIMVEPSHIPSLSATQSFELSYGRLCAFGLESGTQISELLNLGLWCPENPTVTTDGKIVYSDIDTENLMQVRTLGFDIFGEYEHEEASSFSIYPEQTFSYIPTEIFFVAIRDSKWNFNPAFDCSQTQDIILERSTAREIISHRTSANDWFGFSFLDHFDCLSATADDELCLKFQAFEMSIDGILQFNLIGNLIIPSIIYTELQSSLVHSDSLDYLWCSINFDFGCCPDLHNSLKEEEIYKYFAIPPNPKGIGLPCENDLVIF